MAENNNSKKSVNDQTSVNSNIDLGKLKYSDLLPVNEDAHNETRAFLERVASTCIEHVQNQNDRKQKVIDFCQPDEMLAKFDFSIGDEPMSVEQLLADCQRALKLQVKTAVDSIGHGIMAIRLFSDRSHLLHL
ncbi:Glutamate decarboxylase, partial [Fragariocoptes setiger]